MIATLTTQPPIFPRHSVLYTSIAQSIIRIQPRNDAPVIDIMMSSPYQVMEDSTTDLSSLVNVRDPDVTFLQESLSPMCGDSVYYMQNNSLCTISMNITCQDCMFSSMTNQALMTRKDANVISMSLYGIPSALNKLLRDIFVTPSPGLESNMTVGISVNDHGNFGYGDNFEDVSATLVVDILPLNDPPVITVGTSAYVLQLTEKVLSLSNITVSDEDVVLDDENRESVYYSLSISCSFGTLSIDALTDVTSLSQAPSLSGHILQGYVVMLSERLSGLQIALSTLKYYPSLGYSGQDRVNVTLSDATEGHSVTALISILLNMTSQAPLATHRIVYNNDEIVSMDAGSDILVLSYLNGESTDNGLLSNTSAFTDEIQAMVSTVQQGTLAVQSIRTATVHREIEQSIVMYNGNHANALHCELSGTFKVALDLSVYGYGYETVTSGAISFDAIAQTADEIDGGSYTGKQIGGSCVHPLPTPPHPTLPSLLLVLFCVSIIDVWANITHSLLFIRRSPFAF